ncbi:ATP-binding protein [Nocardia sp. NEAU-G5]|uniref:ATP-binding protein n=1 Tax=Nocardia albiluteola TaxID=2842303 RepID=A0ABS6B1I9_9NOCA|nr:AAA family ATPase [Nocardia albiluteola]MBU3063145.1 ATP-binding protein [Nocardia albiluteola]
MPDHDRGPDAPVLSPAATSALQQCAQRLGRRGVVALCGFPASGKSTAARVLASLADAIILDKDGFVPDLEQAVMHRLTGNRFDRDSDIYHDVVAPHVYAGFVRTGLTVGAKVPVVLDAPFLGSIRHAAAAGICLREHLSAVAGIQDTVPMTTVWLDTSPAQIHTRMTSRGADRDAGKLADWSAYETSVLASGLREIAHSVVDVVLAT